MRVPMVFSFSKVQYRHLKFYGGEKVGQLMHIVIFQLLETFTTN